MPPHSAFDDVSHAYFHVQRDSGLPPPKRRDFRSETAFTWLRTPWHHPYWDIASFRQKPVRINWHRRLPDGSCLTDPHHAELLETVRTFCAILMEDPLEAMRLQHSTAAGRVKKLLIVVDWLIARGMARFADVTPADLEHFKTTVNRGAGALAGSEEGDALACSEEGDASPSPLVAGTILEYFRVLQHLYDFHAARFDDGSPILPDGLLLPPFRSGEDAIALAQMLGAEQGKTRTIPPRVALYTLNAAIEWVMYHSTEILELLVNAEQERLNHEARHLTRSLRPTSEEASHRLARLIDGMVRRPSTIPLLGSGVSRQALAARADLSLSTLYKNRACVAMVEALQALVDEQADGRKGLAKQHLTALLEPCLGKWPKTVVERWDQGRLNKAIARSVGLPFTGKTTTRGGPWPISVLGSNARGRSSLEQASNNLWTACFIVLAVFMADRIEELLETDVRCLDLSHPEEPYFINRTWKETDTDTGLEGARPCPQIVVEAAQVMLKLGAGARSRSGSDKLFMADHRSGSSVADETTVRKRLKGFCKWIGIPVDQAGEIWSIAPHQFRRFFVQAFTWHYEIGADLLALKQHLRQADVATVARYATSALRGEMVSEEQKALTTYVMEQAAFDGLDLRGSYGAYLMRLFRRLAVTVRSPEKLVPTIKKYQEKHGIRLRPNPWGYCAWSLSRARFAECAKEAGVANPVGPVDSHRTSSCCGRCLNFVTHRAFAPFWRTSGQRFELMLKVPHLPEELVKAAEDGLALAHRYSAQH
jgi:hypothetical protein